MTLIEIMSKNRKKAPILLQPHVATGIDTLLRARREYTQRDNVYVFGMANSMKCYMGWTSLKIVTKNLDLSNAEAITSTRIRKYVASSSQVCDILYSILG